MKTLYSALTLTLAAEDAAEAAGRLTADGRRTCSTCQTWATPEHLTSDEHWRTIDTASRRVTDEQLAEVTCMVPVPDGVNGKCWRPLPCPDHALSLAEGLALAEVIDARDGVLRQQTRVRLTARRWATWSLPCVHCDSPTHARTHDDLPAHPSCAEVALALADREVTR